MPVVLALLALFLVALAPPVVAAHDLEPTGAEPDVVVVIDASLSPPEVRVPAGSVVGWVNRDGDRHRVRSRGGPVRFDSGNLEHGATFAVRLTAPGTYPYVDDRDRDDAAYHGRIVVTAADAGTSGGNANDGGGGETAAAPDTVAASIGDRVFSPSSIAVAVGGTVTWTNDDDRAHTVTAATGAFDSGVVDEGGTFRQRFDTAGTFPFLCAIHPEMQGEVEVIGADAAAAPASTPAPVPTAAPVATPSPTAIPTASPDADAAGPSEAPGTAIIEMQDFAFGPPEVTVAAGGTVTFANVGDVPHTATADDGAFDTELVAAGTEATIRLETPGSYAFACAFHPEMTGRVLVVEAGPAAVVASPTPSPNSTDAAPAAPVAAGPVDPDLTATSGGGDGLGGLFGLMLGVILVSVAVGLFAKVVGGTVRRPDGAR